MVGGGPGKPYVIGIQISPQKWQYRKSVSLFGHFFLVPMRKAVYKSRGFFLIICKNAESCL